MYNPDRLTAHGYAYNHIASASYTIELDPLTCQPTTPKHRPTYNCSDRTGDHYTSSAHFRKLDPETQTAIKELIDQAKEKARADLEYKQARHRPNVDYHFRFTWLFMAGLGGSTYEYDAAANTGSGRIESYWTDEDHLQTAISLGIPTIDKRAALRHLDAAGLATIAVFRSPMPHLEKELSRNDPPPYHGMSFAPLNVYTYYWQLAGAQVYNVDTSGLTPDIFSDETRSGLDEIRSYLESNPITDPERNPNP